jgi:hypothetical protein
MEDINDIRRAELALKLVHEAHPALARYGFAPSVADLCGGKAPSTAPGSAIDEMVNLAHRALESAKRRAVPITPGSLVRVRRCEMMNSGRPESDRAEEGWCLTSVGTKLIHLSQGKRKLRFDLESGEQAADVTEYELDPDDIVRIQHYAARAASVQKPQGRP